MAEPREAVARKVEEPEVVAKEEVQVRIKVLQLPRLSNPLQEIVGGDPNAVMRRTQANALRTIRRTSGER